MIEIKTENGLVGTWGYVLYVDGRRAHNQIKCSLRAIRNFWNDYRYEICAGYVYDCCLGFYKPK